MVSPVGTGLIPGGRLLAGLVALLEALATSAPVTLPNVYPWCGGHAQSSCQLPA